MLYEWGMLFIIILLSTFLVSVFWLFDSIVSVVLTFTLFVVNLIFILFIIGAEFVPITLSIMYLGGMLILFMFIAFTISNEYNYELNGDDNSSYLKFLKFDYIEFWPIILIIMIKLFVFADLFSSVIPYTIFLITSNSIEDDNIAYIILAETEDIGIFNNILYTEFSFGVVLIALLLYSILIGVVCIVNNKQSCYKYNI